jgi:hypothetical protein
MYSGIVLFCNKTSQQQCLSRKLYTCADQKTKPTDKIKVGTIVFLYNMDDKSLLGPFTALEEGGGALDSGAWAMDIDEHIPSEDVKVTWEELHIIDNAPDQLPFLKDPKTCAITATQTQRILDLLRQGKQYIDVKSKK